MLKKDIATKQTRLDAGPPEDIQQFLYVARALIRWLPTNQCRLLWVDHWDSGSHFPDDALVVAARKGLGDARSIEAAPGHYFDPRPWDEEDQIEVSLKHGEDLALLSGLMLMIIATGSDGWLITDGCSDRVEFWEGNLFLYSSDTAQIQAGEKLLEDYRCPRWPK